MAETLRDLVVSLSLDSGNFSANLKSINAQLKEADLQFKVAGAGVSDFENTAAGAEAKLATLQQKPTDVDAKDNRFSLWLKGR